ncbi:hypothetical protein EJ06DRAFT_584039 [Trichodelitschia bisporula]|uniref:Uncharacterized protein n=1 Tax=Trichodelitschia bisporula TaxID=703511 RepID=A0A6G1HNY9_9PEZI|nr:hypothetical protein EJ06DRAFT_584039 [Trichodelitschia bisporula]
MGFGGYLGRGLSSGARPLSKLSSCGSPRPTTAASRWGSRPVSEILRHSRPKCGVDLHRVDILQHLSGAIKLTNFAQFHSYCVQIRFGMLLLRRNIGVAAFLKGRLRDVDHLRAFIDSPKPVQAVLHTPLVNMKITLLSLPSLALAITLGADPRMMQAGTPPTPFGLTKNAACMNLFCTLEPNVCNGAIDAWGACGECNGFGCIGLGERKCPGGAREC